MPSYFYIFFCYGFSLVSCKNAEQHRVPDSGAATSLQKITAIYKDNVYDLIGYANDGGSPFNLFDENAYVDPRAEKKGDNYIPVTDPQPTANASIYFPLNRGSRIVTDLQVPYKLSEVYIYDRSHLNDSVWIYTGDMLHWKLKAAFETKTDPASWGWR